MLGKALQRRLAPVTGRHLDTSKRLAAEAPEEWKTQETSSIASATDTELRSQRTACLTDGLDPVIGSVFPRTRKWPLAN